MSDNYEKRAREITPPCALCRAGSIHTVENCPPLRVARELRAVDTAAEARGRTLGMEAAEMPKWIETILSGFIPERCICAPHEVGTAACCQNCMQRAAFHRSLAAAEQRGMDAALAKVRGELELDWKTVKKAEGENPLWMMERCEVGDGYLLRTSHRDPFGEVWKIVAEHHVRVGRKKRVSQRDDLEEIAFVAGFSPRVDVPDKQVREWIIAHITDLKSEVQRLSDDLDEHVERPLRQDESA